MGLGWPQPAATVTLASQRNFSLGFLEPLSNKIASEGWGCPGREKRGHVAWESRRGGGGWS